MSDAAITTGPDISLAVWDGEQWRCAACPTVVTGWMIRAAFEHFIAEHGTEADAATIANPGFLALSFGVGRIPSGELHGVIR